MKSIINFWLGFISGAVICGAIALLFTPSSGEGLRKQINERTQSVQGELTKAATERRAELQAQLETLRKPRQVA